MLTNVTAAKPVDTVCEENSQRLLKNRKQRETNKTGWMNKLTDMGVARGFRSGWLYEFRSMLRNKYLVMSKVENIFEYWFKIAHMSFLFLTWLLLFINLYIEDESCCCNYNSLFPLSFKMSATNRRRGCCVDEISVIACSNLQDYLL